jgi:hypothetical protein
MRVLNTDKDNLSIRKGDGKSSMGFVMGLLFQRRWNN